MEPGTLIIAMHDSDGERAVAERLRNHLVSRGRRNIRIGFHSGKPDCYDVFLGMNRDGVDTFCILPLTVFEGNQTVWDMPRHLTLPDNSGSWTMIGEHDVATRFSPAVGADPALGEAVARQLGDPKDDEGVVLVCRGSKLSFPGRVLELYAEYLRGCGWMVSTAFAVRGSRTMADAVADLRECSLLHIVPFYISSCSPSLRASLGDIDVPYVLEPCVSEYGEFIEALASNVPEDW